MIINQTMLNADVPQIISTLKDELDNKGIHLFAKSFDSGDDYMICCPYHKEGQERRPSAGIRKSDGLFHCLACGETKSLPELISNCLGYDDRFGRYGYKWLITNFANYEVTNRESIKVNMERNHISDKSDILGIDNYFEHFGVDDEELDTYRYTHPYLYRRGLTDEIIERFDIGYDKATNSITFPVRFWENPDFGRCLFVVRRRIDVKQFRLPKNIDKPLYGLYEIWEYITNNQIDTPLKEIYVCEGMFDGLRLWCNGKFAVAGFGCLFSKYQIKLLNDLPTRKLVLALDNDEAGIKATNYLKSEIKGKLITRVIHPTNRKDIGEYTDDEIQNIRQSFV